MTIQRRSTFEENFNVGWEDYKLGFGSPLGDHWIGLTHIRALTLKEMSSRGGKARLRIDINNNDGTNM